MIALVARFDAIYALLVSPFIAGMALLIGLAVAYVARRDRKANQFAPPADVAQWRDENWPGAA